MTWCLSPTLDDSAVPRLDLLRSAGAEEPAPPLRPRVTPSALLPLPLLLLPAGALVIRAGRGRPDPDPGPRSGLSSGLAALVRTYYFVARGLYRVFNAAEYRLFRSNAAPPAETDVPFAAATTLPATPDETFGDGTWFVSATYFDGVLDSGFLPLGPQGETYRRLDIAGGELQLAPPAGPTAWEVAAAAGGAVRVLGHLFQPATLYPHQWAIAYTTDGSTPPTGDPDLTQAMAAIGLVWLDLLLPAQAHGTTVKVRLQTRRNDGSEETPAWVYSEASTVLTLSADAQGPTAPTSAVAWPGPLPEDG